MPGAKGLCWLLGFSAEIFDQPWPCIFFISMAPAVGFRCGYLLKELYHERTQNPLEYDLDITLNDVVEVVGPSGKAMQPPACARKRAPRLSNVVFR